MPLMVRCVSCWSAAVGDERGSGGVLLPAASLAAPNSPVAAPATPAALEKLAAFARLYAS
jgi:hypothetical protein